MKAFINNLTSWLIIILSSTLILMFIFACSSPPEGESTPPETTPRGDDDDDKDDKDLACTLPKCSGSDCCNKLKDESKKEKCEDWCGDSDYLGLGSSARDKCLTLDYNFVENDLIELFGEDVLYDPNEEDLIDNIKPGDFNKICAAVRELDSDIWGDIIDDYSPIEAEVVLGWIAQEKKTVQIFEKTQKRADGIDMFRQLLIHLSADSSDDGDIGVLNGLGEPISFDDDDDDDSMRILARALDKSNSELVRFIHQRIVKDPKEGICGKDQDENYPVHTDSNNANANRNQQRACILAVYCKALPTGDNANTDDNKKREELGEEIDESGMKTFITNTVENGGLGLKDANKDGDWDKATCDKLKDLWSNPANNLNLGLD